MNFSTLLIQWHFSFNLSKMKKDGMDDELLNFGDRAGLTLDKELVPTQFIPEPSWFTQFWAYFKTLLKIKYSSKSNIALLVLAAFYSFVFLCLNFGDFKISGNKNPFVLSYSMNDIANKTVSVGPDCELVDKIAQKYNNSLFNVTKFNTENEVYDDLKVKLDNFDIGSYNGIVVDENNENQTSVKVVSMPFLRLISSVLLESLGKKLAVNISSTSFPYAEYALFELSQMMGPAISGLFYFGICFMIFGTLATLFDLEKDKVIHLFRMSHMRDSISFVTVIAFTMFEPFIFCIIGSFLVSFLTIKGTNFLYPFFFFTIGLINLILFILWMMQLVRGKGSLAFVSLVALLSTYGIMGALMYIPNFDHKAVIGLSCFIPTVSTFAAFDHVLKMNSMYSHVDLRLFTYSYNEYSFAKLTGLSLVCTLFHSIIYAVLALCKERWHGRAPLGWKHLFSIGKWKRLFDNSPLSTDSTEVAINISSVDKTFHGEKDVHALNNFDLKIKQGEIIILIGPNGCGKTTLISAITAAQNFDSGEIDIYDNNIDENPNAVRNIGIVFQESVFIKELTARENLKFFGTIRGLTKSLESDITYLADQIGLTHCLDSQASSMSGGEKRKLSILIALLQRPQILVLDEPTAGVDVSACQQIWKVINSYKDTTSLISAHALEEAESVCSKIIVMQKGELKFGGSPAELREQTGCGYKLSVEDDNYNYEQLLEFAKQYQPKAKILEGQNCISLPNDTQTTDAIIAIGKEKERFGFKSFSVHVENLEDNLIRFIAEHEDAI